MIGIDIIYIERVRKAVQSSHFLHRVFTPHEINYAQQKHDACQTLAGIYAAKEAVAKALERGFYGVSLRDIHVLHHQNGCPYAQVFDQKIEISITHDGGFAVAIALATPTNITNIRTILGKTSKNIDFSALPNVVETKTLDQKTASIKQKTAQINDEDGSQNAKNTQELEKIASNIRTILGKTSKNIDFSALPNVVETKIGARFADTHKRCYASVRVIGGCSQMIGAPLLSAKAALKSGCGLVKLCVARSLAHAYQGRITEEMLMLLPDENGFITCDKQALDAAIKDADAIVVGPGMGANPHLRKIIAHLCQEFSGTLILDADALNALSNTKIHPQIITDIGNNTNNFGSIFTNSQSNFPLEFTINSSNFGAEIDENNCVFPLEFTSNTNNFGSNFTNSQSNFPLEFTSNTNNFGANADKNNDNFPLDFTNNTNNFGAETDENNCVFPLEFTSNSSNSIQSLDKKSNNNIPDIDISDSKIPSNFDAEREPLDPIKNHRCTLIITPHIAEFTRLLNANNSAKNPNFAQKITENTDKMRKITQKTAKFTNHGTALQSEKFADFTVLQSEKFANDTALQSEKFADFTAQRAAKNPQKSIAAQAVEFAQRHDCVVVLKSHSTLITDGIRSYKNTVDARTGDDLPIPNGASLARSGDDLPIPNGASLARGGSGDVLTGIIASFCAHMPAVDACAQACLTLSRAALMAESHTHPDSILPTDICNEIAKLL